MYLSDEVITRASWIIRIIILCTVAAIIVPIVKEVVYEKYEKKVIETSQRYMDIQKLNREYDFNAVPPYIIWNKMLDSKGQYDRLDLNQFFVDKVDENKEKLKRYEASVVENQLLARAYDCELEKIHNYADEDYVKRLKLSWKMYHRVECEICEEERLYPVEQVKIKCTKYYTSPQGRNHYENSLYYYARELEQAFKLSEERKDFQKSKQYQRQAMSSTLRYEILKRDGFHCVLCGRGREDGVKLEVDHIVPVSKGGKTIKSNLRTLCQDCNRGKSDKYDPNGVN